MTVKTKRVRLLALTEEGKAGNCFTVGKCIPAYSTLTPA